MRQGDKSGGFYRMSTTTARTMWSVTSSGWQTWAGGPSRCLLSPTSSLKSRSRLLALLHCETMINKRATMTPTSGSLLSVVRQSLREGGGVTEPRKMRKKPDERKGKDAEVNTFQACFNKLMELIKC